MRRFILVAGGIHTTPEGLPCRSMDHNAAREAAIDEIKQACEVAAGAWAQVALWLHVLWEPARRLGGPAC